jgi:hypothetical protein
MEQSRIEFIRDGLSVYINLVSGISAEEREVMLIHFIYQCQTRNAKKIDHMD